MDAVNLYILFLNKALVSYIQSGAFEDWLEYKTGFEEMVIKELILPVQIIERFDFSSVKFVDSYFSGWKLTNSNFSQAKLVKVNISFSEWTQLIFENATFYNVEMQCNQVMDSDFSAASITHSYWINGHYENCDFRDAQFMYSNLQHVTFKNCSFASTRFESVNLDQAKFIDCDLTDVQFQDCVNMTSAHFTSLPAKLKKKRRDVIVSTEDLNYYCNLLTLDQKAFDYEMLSKRFRKLVKKYHPDKFRHKGEEKHLEAQEIFQRIQEAYLFLCDHLNKEKTVLVSAEMTIKNLRYIIEQDPKNDVAFYNLGILYFKQGDYDQSIEAYQKSIEINAHNQLAQHNLKVTELAKTIYQSVSKRK